MTLKYKPSSKIDKLRSSVRETLLHFKTLMIFWLKNVFKNRKSFRIWATFHYPSWTLSKCYGKTMKIWSTKLKTKDKLLNKSIIICTRLIKKTNISKINFIWHIMTFTKFKRKNMPFKNIFILFWVTIKNLFKLEKILTFMKILKIKEIS